MGHHKAMWPHPTPSGSVFDHEGVRECAKQKISYTTGARHSGQEFLTCSQGPMQSRWKVWWHGSSRAGWLRWISSRQIEQLGTSPVLRSRLTTTDLPGTRGDDGGWASWMRSRAEHATSTDSMPSPR